MGTAGPFGCWHGSLLRVERGTATNAAAARCRGMRMPVRLRALAAALSLVLALVGLGGFQLDRVGWTHAAAAPVVSSGHPSAPASQLATATHHAMPVHARGGLDIGAVRPVLSSATDRSITEVSIEPGVVLVATKYAVSQRAPPVADAV